MSLQEMSETDRIVNRHKARILTELEEANCPVVFIQAVKSNLDWLRSDLNELKENKPVISELLHSSNIPLTRSTLKELKGHQNEGSVLPPVRK